MEAKHDNRSEVGLSPKAFQSNDSEMCLDEGRKFLALSKIVKPDVTRMYVMVRFLNIVQMTDLNFHSLNLRKDPNFQL